MYILLSIIICTMLFIDIFIKRICFPIRDSRNSLLWFIVRKTKNKKMKSFGMKLLLYLMEKGR